MGVFRIFLVDVKGGWAGSLSERRLLVPAEERATTVPSPAGGTGSYGAW